MDENRNGKNPWENEYGNQNKEDPSPRTPNPMDPAYNLAVLAIGLGISSVVLCMSGGLGLIMAGISIMMAILSKGNNKKMLPQAKKALAFSLIGIVAGYSVMISSFHTVMTDPSLRKQLNTISEEMNGISFDDMLKQIESDLGVSFGSDV